MDNLEIIKSILTNLTAASKRLDEALSLEKTMINLDATIQRFKFTFELSWKLMKSLNYYYGQDCYSPRECLRLAAQNSLIVNLDEWFTYLKARNTASHVYDEQEADVVYESAKLFSQDIAAFISTVESKIKDL